jgi:hypothetical protein
VTVIVKFIRKKNILSVDWKQIASRV